MFTCRHCLWRYVDVFDAPATNVHRLQQTADRHITASRPRHLSTQGAARTSITPAYRSSELGKLQANAEEPWKKSAVHANQKQRERLALTREAPNLEKLWKRHPSISDSDWNRRKRELRFLQDPLELADFVKKQLVKNKITEAQQLVIMASQSMDCVVSWNHIVDYLFAKGKINEAFKVYNDVRQSRVY